MNTTTKLAKVCGAALVVLALVAAACLCFMQSVTTYTSDDYYYKALAEDGATDFISNNITHFQTRNGRVLVHVVAQLWLYCPLSLYALSLTLLLFFASWLLLRFQGRGGGTVLWALSFALFYILLFCADFSIMKRSFLCVSDAANYILPLFFIGLFLFVIERADTFLFRLLALFLAFVAGATTEQGAVMAISVMLVYALSLWITKKRIPWMSLIAILFLGAGLMTIFMSPATTDRASSEFALSLLGYLRYANSLSSPNTSLGFTALTAFLLGLLPLTKKAPRILFIGLPTSVILLTGYIVPRDIVFDAVFCALFLAFLLCSATVLVFTSAYHKSGCLLLGGVASAVLMFFSQSGSIRVTTPLLLIITVFCAFSVGELAAFAAQRTPNVTFTASVAVLVLVFSCALAKQLPFMRGMYKNDLIRQTNNAMTEVARETGVLTYRDYDARYALQDLFSDDIITGMYLDCYGIAGASVEYNHTDITLSYNGRQVAGVLKYGKVYVPFGDIVSSFDASLTYITSSYMETDLLNTKSVLTDTALYVDGAVYPMDCDLIKHKGRMCISAELLMRAYGITYQNPNTTPR